MAHGLRRISNKSYNPYGTGRDWFFLGDSEYRDGRVTPQPNHKCLRPVPQPTGPKGLTHEVVFQKQACGSRKKVLEKWRKMHDEQTVLASGSPGHQDPTAGGSSDSGSPTALGPKPRRRGPVGRRQEPLWSDNGAPATTYNEMGRDPRFTGGRYSLTLAEERAHIGVPRSASESALKLMEGDHTRGVRSERPHFSSTYGDLGQDPSYSGPRLVLQRAEENSGAGVPRDSSLPVPKELEGDHSRGIRCGLPQFFSTYMDLGHGKRPYTGARRHELLDAETNRGAGVPPPAGVPIPPKEMEGDHCLGIKGQKKHYRSTMADLGDLLKFTRWTDT